MMIEDVYFHARMLFQAKMIAMDRPKTAGNFYDGLYKEIAQNYRAGAGELAELFGEDRSG